VVAHLSTHSLPAAKKNGENQQFRSPKFVNIPQKRRIRFSEKNERVLYSTDTDECRGDRQYHTTHGAMGHANGRAKIGASNKNEGVDRGFAAQGVGFDRQTRLNLGAQKGKIAFTRNHGLTPTPKRTEKPRAKAGRHRLERNGRGKDP